MATCLFVVSCISAPDHVAIVESDPIPDPKNNVLPRKAAGEGPPVELRVKNISISGQYMKLEVINRTSSTLSSIKGNVTFVDRKGNSITDSLQIRAFQPFSAYTPQGLVGPNLRETITVQTIVPSGCKNAKIELKQASHADGTVMQFKSSLY